jgi:hypothetical protein
MELLKLYTDELARRFEIDPEYQGSLGHIAPGDLAQKMLVKIQAGEVVSLAANPALKTACRKMGITTYKALAEYVQGFGCVA